MKTQHAWFKQCSTQNLLSAGAVPPSVDRAKRRVEQESCTGHGRFGSRLLVIVAMVAMPGVARAQAILLEGEAARQRAARKGWVVRRDTPTQTMELQRVVNGIPLYYITTNSDAADTISTDELLPGGASGYERTGAGVILGMWDAGAVRRTQREFTGRAVQQDSPPIQHNHATHAAGTMMAAGLDAPARGMSPAAILRCYDWNNDENEMEDQGGDLRVSNSCFRLVPHLHR